MENVDVWRCSCSVEGSDGDWIPAEVCFFEEFFLLVDLDLIIILIYFLYRDNPPKHIISINPTYNLGFVHRPTQQFVDPSSGFLLYLNLYFNLYIVFTYNVEYLYDNSFNLPCSRICNFGDDDF